jgi:hypothetical protein
LVSPFVIEEIHRGGSRSIDIGDDAMITEKKRGRKREGGGYDVGVDVVRVDDVNVLMLIKK